MKQEVTTDQPLVTFALFAYNQEDYIQEAIDGALSQNYSRLEIVFSDDCSTDGTFEIMKNAAHKYRGPHQISVRQNKRNLGVALHFDLVMREARGEVVVVAAGDDVSMPDRSLTSVQAYIKDRRVGCIESACTDFSGDADSARASVTDKGEERVFYIEDVLNGAAPKLVGAGRAYIRSRYIGYPPLLTGCPSEDTPALLRSIYGSYGLYLSAPMVLRRIHQDNLSSMKSMASMDFGSLEKQYLLDIESAVAIGVISLGERDSILAGLKGYVFKKKARVSAFKGFDGDIGIIDILISTLISPKQKLRYFRHWLACRIVSWRKAVGLSS